VNKDITDLVCVLRNQIGSCGYERHDRAVVIQAEDVLVPEPIQPLSRDVIAPLTEADIAEAMEKVQAKIAELEAENARLRTALAQQTSQ